MMVNSPPAFQKIRAWLIDHSALVTPLADCLSLVGILFYSFELWHFAHIQYSVLDEGLYLYKGLLFATGMYAPFQAFGPWTNQMPLAFFIPGWVELIFGPGLRTGRMFALALGVLTILGLWLTARRLGGRWIAAAIVGAVILNPAVARMLSMAASQGLAACLLVWTMFFSLGEDRPNWQLALAGLLAGIVVMVRINLLPILPLLLLYVLWARGWKSALWIFAGELFIFGAIHLIYWPNILQIWAKWLPFPFLKPWALPQSVPTWDPDNPFGFRVASFFLVFRYHFAALVGALATWIFWPKEWKSSAQFKAAVYLSFLLFVLFSLHAWAALGNEYCVFCFPTYTSFYSGVGLILVAVTLPSWQFEIPAWRKWLGSLVIFGLLAGMAYSAEGTAESLLGEMFYKRLLSAPVPGLNGAQVWQVVSNKFRLEYEIIYDAVHAWFPVLLAILFGLSLFAVLKGLNGRKNSAMSGALLAFVILGTVFSPARLLAGEYNSYDCQNDVIPGYESVGTELAEVIPPGSTVYWAGYSPVTLLYLPDAKIYPAQLHGIYSFRISNDDNALAKYGWWNQHLAEKWLAEADFVLAEERSIARNDWLTQALEDGSHQEIAVTGLQAECQQDSFFHVFRRK
jgi:hypothetical protein